MLKISHIKKGCINIILLWWIVVFGSCYMPQGAFLAEPINRHIHPNDSIHIALPTEFQVYNYFKVTYLKNNEVFKAEKQDDSIIVFLAGTNLKMEPNLMFRIEVGIVPFFEE